MGRCGEKSKVGVTSDPRSDWECALRAAYSEIPQFVCTLTSYEEEEEEEDGNEEGSARAEGYSPLLQCPKESLFGAGAVHAKWETWKIYTLADLPEINREDKSSDELASTTDESEKSEEESEIIKRELIPSEIDRGSNKFSALTEVESVSCQQIQMIQEEPERETVSECFQLADETIAMVRLKPRESERLSSDAHIQEEVNRKTNADCTLYEEDVSFRGDFCASLLDESLIVHCRTDTDCTLSEEEMSFRRNFCSTLTDEAFHMASDSGADLAQMWLAPCRYAFQSETATDEDTGYRCTEIYTPYSEEGQLTQKTFRDSDREMGFVADTEGASCVVSAQDAFFQVENQKECTEKGYTGPASPWTPSKLFVHQNEAFGTGTDNFDLSWSAQEEADDIHESWSDWSEASAEVSQDLKKLVQVRVFRALEMEEEEEQQDYPDWSLHERSTVCEMEHAQYGLQSSVVNAHYVTKASPALRVVV